jgi:hypothetical protein
MRQDAETKLKREKMKKTWTEAKSKIEEWIGNGENFLTELSDEKAEKLFAWLEENDINIENPEDMNKVENYIAKL